MGDQLDFEITNVGGVEHAEFHFKPGVNVLRGANGVGKTSSINAIRRALGESVEVERRDGADHGTVTGPGGVKLRVGKVARATGRAEVALADTTPVSKLIDPQIKDPEAAARAEVNALVELLRVEVSEEAIRTLAAGDEDLVAYGLHIAAEEGIDDLLVLQRKLKGHAEGLARAREDDAAAAEGAAEAAEARRAKLLETTGPIDGEVPSVADAQGALVEASRTLERLEAQCDAREALEASQRRVREALGDRVDPKRAREALEGATAARKRAEKAAQEARLAQMRADEALVAAEENEAAMERDLRSAEKAAEILERTPEGATREAVEAAAAAVESSKRVVESAQAADQVRLLEAEARAARDVVEGQKADGERLRSLAQGIPTRLAEVLEAAGAPGLTVVEGRLAAVRDGQVLDWRKRLSEGQRVTIALELAARRYAEGLVPIAGSFWNALDPPAQEAFAKVAAAKGLYVVTEEPTGGDLRSEVMA